MQSVATLGAANATTGQQMPSSQWTVAEATQWYDGLGWLTGCNFIPSSAVNQLEMWQAETFDQSRIDFELGLASGVGLNTIRVFLHDLLWRQDAEGFLRRIDTVLNNAATHGLKVILVLFDSCWNPHPRSGPQDPPTPGVHNSQWVQSPGAVVLQDQSQYPRLKDYVTNVMTAFGKDPRVLIWDLWNEPDNLGPQGSAEIKQAVKHELVRNLLPQVFAWARLAGAAQPLTSGVWQGDWSDDARLTPIQYIQLKSSDVVSFHCYGWPEEFEQRATWLKRFGRPVLCTEYMARAVGSTFDTIAPLAKNLGVAALNWGLVAGKTQTWLPWESWQHPYVVEPPPIWFHDWFHADGMPYRAREVEIMRLLAAR